MPLNLKNKDIEYLKSYEIKTESLEFQYQLLVEGVKFSHIVKPATLNDGIIKIELDMYDYYLLKYQDASNSGKIEKFIPASGAASRMFQSLAYVLNNFAYTEYDVLKVLEDTDLQIEDCVFFLKNIKEIPFFDYLQKAMKEQDIEINDLIDKSDFAEILRFILSTDGLNYGFLPKALIPFHKYEFETQTPLFEHLAESEIFGLDNKRNAKIHFTVSSDHFDLIEQSLNKLINSIFGINFDISMSVQSKSTNTIALDASNEIVRDQFGRILLRPAGHGALLENLNKLGSDIIAIKNIDNVAPINKHSDLVIYRKLLVGFFVDIQEKTFKYLYELDNENLDETKLKEIEEFGCNILMVPLDFSIYNTWEIKSLLKEKLNRPIRICGMVKNEGEPGGGPFWVRDESNEISLQIVESSQVDKSKSDQLTILKSSTHFNPVDIVCGLKNYKGEKFDLLQFVDYNMSIITSKDYNGTNIKVLEKPGLWNGSMANWNTIFVELPISTFNPVKSVIDLLRENHKV
ncbi:MAG: DUF4301 family protein [Candidatus Kapabacteria bacterium]|nr:DUF4301 family protein [Candidatus Kapabacteria bacterium]